MKFDNSILRVEIKSALATIRSLIDNFKESDDETNIKKANYVYDRLTGIRDLADELDSKLQEENK